LIWLSISLVTTSSCEHGNEILGSLTTRELSRLVVELCSMNLVYRILFQASSSYASHPQPGTLVILSSTATDPHSINTACLSHVQEALVVKFSLLRKKKAAVEQLTIYRIWKTLGSYLCQ
jgi:hypothetical protein